MMMFVSDFVIFVLFCWMLFTDDLMMLMDSWNVGMLGWFWQFLETWLELVLLQFDIVTGFGLFLVFFIMD